jgi:hypothetical protein
MRPFTPPAWNARTRRLLFVVVVLFLLTFPLVNTLLTRARVDRDGVDVSASVVEAVDDGGRYLVSFRFPESVDPEQDRYAAVVGRTTYDVARATRKVDVRVLEGEPRHHHVAGEVYSKDPWIFTLVGDAIVLLVGLWWVRVGRRRPGRAHERRDGHQRHADDRHGVPRDGPRPVPSGPVRQRAGEQPEAERRGLPRAGDQADHERRGAERREVGAGHRPGALVDHVGGEADDAEPRDHAPGRHPTNIPQARTRVPTAAWLSWPLSRTTTTRSSSSMVTEEPSVAETGPIATYTSPVSLTSPVGSSSGASSRSRMASIRRAGRRRPTRTHHSPTSSTIASPTRVKIHGSLL